MSEVKPVATVFCLRGESYAGGHFIEVQLQITPGTELPIGTHLYDERVVAELRAKLEEADADCMEVIKERDWAQDCLQQAHIALGGDGEWTAKLPAEPPPESGDLHLDVPALAAEVLHRAERAEARVAELERFHDVVQTAMQIHVIDEDAIKWIDQQLAKGGEGCAKNAHTAVATYLAEPPHD